ncbi:hypothetical protein Aab01nite_26650 [Paractinoplanes abujensis]|nr:hypothetical protein Aab01nite_26650 [Actinoplanes abujensis]
MRVAGGQRREAQRDRGAEAAARGTAGTRRGGGGAGHSETAAQGTTGTRLSAWRECGGCGRHGGLGTLGGSTEEGVSGGRREQTTA